MPLVRVPRTLPKIRSPTEVYAVVAVLRSPRDRAGPLDVDAARLAIGGVSDGASYALALGLSNGDIFSTVLAFSPGFLVAPEPAGQPRIFVSHGTADPILPIDACSRSFVPVLRQAGYDVRFHEFDGGHTVPPPISDEAMRWWLSGSGL
jgi:predicted esterase